MNDKAAVEAQVAALRIIRTYIDTGQAAGIEAFTTAIYDLADTHGDRGGGLVSSAILHTTVELVRVLAEHTSSSTGAILDSMTLSIHPDTRDMQQLDPDQNE